MHNHVKAQWLEMLLDLANNGMEKLYAPGPIATTNSGNAWFWLCHAHQMATGKWGWRFNPRRNTFSYLGYYYCPPMEVRQWAGLADLKPMDFVRIGRLPTLEDVVEYVGKI